MNAHTDDIHAMLFSHLVTSLSMSALQQLGKIINPMTGKTEVHLDGAQATIDMLDMLEAKTKGNLGKEEAKLLKDTLGMLKINYVETANSQPAATDAAGQTAPPAAPETPSPTPEAGSTEAAKTQPPADSKEPKFHKSYGEN